MTIIVMYLIQLALTLLACTLLTSYLRPHLKRVLIDLCRTEARAKFWAAFSNIFLIVLPVIFGMGYRPASAPGQNILGFVLAVLVTGGAVSFFALVAPRPTQEKS